MCGKQNGLKVKSIKKKSDKTLATHLAQKRSKKLQQVVKSTNLCQYIHMCFSSTELNRFSRLQISAAVHYFVLQLVSSCLWTNIFQTDFCFWHFKQTSTKIWSAAFVGVWRFTREGLVGWAEVIKELNFLLRWFCIMQMSQQSQLYCRPKGWFVRFFCF